MQFCEENWPNKWQKFQNFPNFNEFMHFFVKFSKDFVDWNVEKCKQGKSDSPVGFPKKLMQFS